MRWAPGILQCMNASKKCLDNVGTDDAGKISLMELEQHWDVGVDTLTFLTKVGAQRAGAIVQANKNNSTSTDASKQQERFDVSMSFLNMPYNLNNQNNLQTDHVHLLLLFGRVGTCWWGSFCRSKKGGWFGFGTC